MTEASLLSLAGYRIQFVKQATVIPAHEPESRV